MSPGLWMGTLASSLPSRPMDVVGSYEITSTVTSFSLSSIPSQYEHLHMECLIRGNSNGFSPFVRFNDDSSQSYSFHLFGSHGTGFQTGSSTNQTWLQLYGSAIGFNATYPFAVITDIINYKDTSKWKTVRSIAGIRSSASSGELNHFSGTWAKTEAINKITFTTNGGGGYGLGYVKLYGIRA